MYAHEAGGVEVFPVGYDDLPAAAMVFLLFSGS